MRQVIDLIGQRFGRLIVLEQITQRKNGSVFWKCKCDCGIICEIRGTCLKRGDTKSCGCYQRDLLFKDLSNRIFGRLTVLKRIENLKPGITRWLCRCDCGNICKVTSRSLKTGDTVSCGCYKREKAFETRALEKGKAAFNCLYSKYKRSARKRGLIFELSDEQFEKLTKQNCYYCGKKPNKTMYEAHFNGDYVWNGIDRIDNSKGYILDNCVSCCEYCNRGKLTKTRNEFLEWIEAVYNYSIANKK